MEEFENLKLFARTRDVSPPLIEMFLGAIVEKGISAVWDKIRRETIKSHERVHLLSRLFGFCRNADFVIGMRQPWLEENPWSSKDLSAAEDTLINLSKVFSGRPEIPQKEGEPPPFDPLGNVVSIGGPISNTFTRRVMGIQKPSDKTDLPYSFNLCPTTECEDKSFEELQRLEPEPNWSIMRGDKEIYIPEYYDEVCRRDYGMIIKIRNVIPEAPRGRRNLVLAGCRGFGTIAAARALGSLEILDELWKKAGDKDFQAIVMGEVSEDEVDYVELLEIAPLM